MAYNEALAARVRAALGRRKTLTERKMFGGVGFLLAGNMACGVLNNDLILRLGADRAKEALAERRVRPFDITGRAMAGWAMIDGGALDDQELAEWVRQAAGFASSLPAK